MRALSLGECALLFAASAAVWFFGTAIGSFTRADVPAAWTRECGVTLSKDADQATLHCGKYEDSTEIDPAVATAISKNATFHCTAYPTRGLLREFDLQCKSEGATMNRSEYEASTLTAITAPFRRKPGISDSDVAGEYRAMAILKAAYPQFVSYMQDAAALSDIKRNDIHDALVVLADAMPGFEAWSEAISDARRDY